MKSLFLLMLCSLILSVAILVSSIMNNNLEGTILSAILCIASASGGAMSAKILDERKQF